MPHFLINSNNITQNIINIKDKDLHQHIIKVLRVNIGEQIKFIDENKIQYETILESIEGSQFKCFINKKYKSERELGLKLYIAQAVLNSDAQISSIQKATELGAVGIIPLYTDNCSVKESVIKNKTEKWKKIILESVKQCERADIPVLSDMKRLKDVCGIYDKTIVFAEKYANNNFFDYIKQNPIQKTESILIIIGPEGGFSNAEFDYFLQNKIPLITMGNLIYRADTALTAAITTVINGVLYG